MMAHEQSNQIFEILRRKAEEEKVAAAKKAALKREMMRKESVARIAAAAAAVAHPRAPAKRKVVGEEDDTIGEVCPEVTNISLRFAAPPEEIVRIFHNRFKPINLYRLRHMRGLRYGAFQDRERIGIQDGMLQLRKTTSESQCYHTWLNGVI